MSSKFVLRRASDQYQPSWNFPNPEGPMTNPNTIYWLFTPVSINQNYHPYHPSCDLFGMVKWPLQRLLVTSNDRGQNGHGLNHLDGIHFCLWSSHDMMRCNLPEAQVPPASLLGFSLGTTSKIIQNHLVHVATCHFTTDLYVPQHSAPRSCQRIQIKLR